jgi:hypothetical protein
MHRLRLDQRLQLSDWRLVVAAFGSGSDHQVDPVDTSTATGL